MQTLATREVVTARMVNEFTYCPRLAYLEWVEGEWHENSDTVGGTLAHRRVDRPKGHFPARDPDQILHARSVSLSDEQLGLSAKLDLIEAEGDRATPVDYKKSKRPHVAKGAYDPERVQLCAQGLLLRAHGYRCDHGVLYYAGSKERVKVEFDEELVNMTRASIEGCRLLREEPMPEPLRDSPKCPRCSLVSICLPDEVSYFKNGSHEPRPIAVRDEGRLPCIIQAPFATVRKSGRVLEVHIDEQTQTLRVDEISHMALYGNIHLTTSALQTLFRKGIPITWLSRGGWFYGTAQALSANVHVRIAQFERAADPATCLSISKQLVKAKILNSRTLLMRNSRVDSSSACDRLKTYAGQAERVRKTSRLLGIEGQAAAVYFGAFDSMLNQATGFSFRHRNRRPPRDPVNALLSLGYSALVRHWTVALAAVGLDPHYGFFHRVRPARPALALDMMEPFRPLIADSAAITAINNGELTADSFVCRGDRCSLTAAGRKAFFSALERRLSQEITHPLFGYRLSYRRLFELEARLLIRFLQGEVPHYPGFTTR